MAVVRAAFEHLRVNPNKFKPLPSRVKVRALFRKICREAPRIVTIYELPHSAADVRRVVKLLFVQHKDVTDERMIEMLVTKGEMELEETLLQYKQRSHVFTLLDQTHLLGKEEYGAEPEPFSGETFLDQDFKERTQPVIEKLQKLV